MEQKQAVHLEKMQQLRKHFKKLKLRAILLWLAFCVAAITVALMFLSVEMTIITVIVAFIISTMFMINYLNRLDGIRIAQETQLMEETPMGKMKF